MGGEGDCCREGKGDSRKHDKARYRGQKDTRL